MDVVPKARHMATDQNFFHIAATRFGLLLFLASFLTSCKKADVPPSKLIIDFPLTEKLTQIQATVPVESEGVEVYSSGVLAERERFYLSIEDLRSHSQRLVTSDSRNAIQSAIGAIKAGNALLSADTHYPSTRQRGTTFHIVFSFDRGSRFAYFQLFVPSDPDVGTIIIPRSDSPVLIGDPLRNWIIEMQRLPH